MPRPDAGVIPAEMQDVDDEIREIKKEIIESRSLVIKTNNLTNSLAADIKSIGKRQADYERRFNWNGAVAYVVVATLSFVGLKLWSDVRVGEIESEKETLARQVQDLRRDVAEQTRQAARRANAEAKAADYYKLIKHRERVAVVEGYDDVRAEQLSRTEAQVFRDTVEQFRLDLSVAAYQAGLGLMRTGRFAEATDKFHEAIRLKEGASHLPALKLQLGRALLRLGRAEQAAVYARQVLGQNVDRDLHVEAAWLLSHCAEANGRLDEARNAIRTILRRWPRSALIPAARRRRAELRHKILKQWSSDSKPPKP
ncbi:MAG: tetratricopeptide repeat protein [Proteobacteria bacterium]|nr:tetratricopeptide repeat protein [Pseudomonadota bacterium]